MLYVLLAHAVIINRPGDRIEGSEREELGGGLERVRLEREGLSPF